MENRALSLLYRYAVAQYIGAAFGRQEILARSVEPMWEDHEHPWTDAGGARL